MTRERKNPKKNPRKFWTFPLDRLLELIEGAKET
jgi:hypothetical protein